MDKTVLATQRASISWFCCARITGSPAIIPLTSGRERCSRSLIQPSEQSLHAIARFVLNGRSSGKQRSIHGGSTRARTARPLPQKRQVPPSLGERRVQVTRIGTLSGG